MEFDPITEDVKEHFRKQLIRVLRIIGDRPSGDASSSVLFRHAREMLSVLSPTPPTPAPTFTIHRPDLPSHSTIDLNAVERILEIVGKKLVRPPQNGVGQVGEDRIKEEFRRSLRDSVKSYETQIINRSSKVIRNKIASVKKVRTAADRLRVALVEASNQGITIGSIESIYRKMDFVEAMLRIHLEPSNKREKKEKKVRGRTPSAFDWLVGVYLSENYQDYFGEMPTLKRSTENVPDSAYVHFVLQVLNEFGITYKGRPYQPEAIVSSLSATRTGRIRVKRRKAPSGQGR
jgi:hypothetical protein